jgi:C_GCAxxG_C_C family probable redox protein
MRKLDRLWKASEEEKKAILLKVKQTAREDEIAITGCARSTLHALQEHLGLGNEEVIRGLAPFAGGAARTGNLCGALIGGIVAIGLAYAPTTLRGALEIPGYVQSMDVAGIFYDRFTEKFGAVNCTDIQQLMWGRSWNLRDPHEREDYLQPQYHDKCGDVAGEAAMLAAEIILANPPE